jgi:predicted PurR-regulated permease PerM
MSETTGLSDSQKWLILAVVTGTGALIYLLGPVLAPFMASALLAYLGDPLVDHLESRKLSRTVGVGIVFVGMLSFATVSVMIIFPALEQQVVVLAGKLPQLLIWADERLLPWLNQRFGLNVDIDPAALRDHLTGHWGELSSVLRKVLMQLGRSSQALLGWVSFLFLVPVVTFYLLRDWDGLVNQLRELIPRRYEPRVVKIVSEIDVVLAEFLRGQLTLMAALATIYVLGLWAVGLELAFSIGIIAGLVSCEPYLGVIVGVLLASGAALLQYGDLWHLLAVVAVFCIGQMLEGMVLSPLLVGERIGLHPVAVIFSVMAGGQLFGFVGVLLALPVAAAVVVLLRHSRDEYKRSSLYDQAPIVPP